MRTATLRTKRECNSHRIQGCPGNADLQRATPVCRHRMLHACTPLNIVHTLTHVQSLWSTCSRNVSSATQRIHSCEFQHGATHLRKKKQENTRPWQKRREACRRPEKAVQPPPHPPPKQETKNFLPKHPHPQLPALCG